MTKESLNKMLDTIAENKLNPYYIFQLTEIALALAKSDLVNFKFKKKLFQIIQKNAYLRDKSSVFGNNFHRLYIMYKNGIGVKKNLKAALDCLMEMAKDGDTATSIKVALMYRDGNAEFGIKPDKEKMIEWCFKIAEYNCPFLLYILALQTSGKKVMPHYDLGVNKSLPLAVKCLEKLIEDPETAYKISWDFHKCLRHILKNSNGNSSDTSNDLEFLVAKGTEEIWWSCKGYHYTRITSAHIINLLGNVLYEMGNYEMAIKFFEYASSFKSLSAYIKLIEMYGQGIGVELNIKRSFLLKKSIADLALTSDFEDYWDLPIDEEHKVLEVIESVAESYHYGIGVNQSLEEAVKYYNIAVKYSKIMDDGNWMLHLPEYLEENMAEANSDIDKSA